MYTFCELAQSAELYYARLQHFKEHIDVYSRTQIPSGEYFKQGVASTS